LTTTLAKPLLHFKPEVIPGVLTERGDESAEKETATDTECMRDPEKNLPLAKQACGLRPDGSCGGR
jgi:hypothetical protein